MPSSTTVIIPMFQAASVFMRQLLVSLDGLTIRLQPRRLRIVPAAVSCKPMLGTADLIDSRKQIFMADRDVKPELVEISRWGPSQPSYGLQLSRVSDTEWIQGYRQPRARLRSSPGACRVRRNSQFVRRHRRGIEQEMRTKKQSGPCDRPATVCLKPDTTIEVRLKPDTTIVVRLKPDTTSKRVRPYGLPRRCRCS